MLIKLRSLAASGGWLLTRLHAEAFSTLGQAPRANGIQTQSKESSTCCVGWLPFVPTPQQQQRSSPRSFHVALGGTLPAGSSLLRMSTENNAVGPSVGTSGEEDHSVLDALIEQFTSPKSGNVTATVEEYLDLCDHALLTHLRGRIESAGAQSSVGMALKHVEEEINMAMQRRLGSADRNLRLVLDMAPDIKKMEAAIRSYFREGKVDMAFMVMISMNLQRAKEAEGADHAVMLLTHLTTFIMALQDERLNPEVKLLRVLLRTDCDGVRKSMLRDALQLPNQDIFLERPPDKDKVQPHLIQTAITDMIDQVEELGQAIDVGLTDSLKGLQVEINDVVKGSQRPGPFRQ